MDLINVKTLSIEEKLVLRELFSSDDPEAMNMVTAILSLTDEDQQGANDGNPTSRPSNHKKSSNDNSDGSEDSDDNDDDDWSDDEIAVIKAYYENEEEDDMLDLPDQPDLAELFPKTASGRVGGDDEAVVVDHQSISSSSSSTSSSTSADNDDDNDSDYEDNRHQLHQRRLDYFNRPSSTRKGKQRRTPDNIGQRRRSSRQQQPSPRKRARKLPTTVTSV